MNLSDRQLKTVREAYGVLSVDQDARVSAPPVPDKAVGAMSPAHSWGLDRIDQRFLPLDNNFSSHGSGQGVTAYIVDTGIDFTHPEFGGRAVRGFDAIGDGRSGADCNGHGTHIAGTVGGTTYGVARSLRRPRGDGRRDQPLRRGDGLLELGPVPRPLRPGPGPRAAVATGRRFPSGHTRVAGGPRRRMRR
ncbi:S8 family serine peptidase [Streptomyces sp. NPDC048551]|uniref:S8 family serine peptidase n=1 Tax=Streptomyces sp. NPDC048551 TaxID=3155758 RepID=UPI003441CF2D